jgi:hypothetical protein
MLLVLRDYTKISTMDGPQTRTEKKGRKKGEKGVIYSAKHVRLTEALAGSSTSGSAREPKAANAKGPQRKR